ncbi:MAG: FHA domain-containing protein [Gemmatales bacterium]
MSELPHAPATVPMNDIPMAEPIVADTSSYEAMPTLKQAVLATAQEDTSSYTPEKVNAALDATPKQDPQSLPIMTTPKLVVIRGQKLNVEYPLYTGDNYIGRTDEKPVDIDLEDQEATDRIWCSRQHAKIISEEHGLSIEDLGSQNGTFVNRARIFPGQVRPLQNGDVVQIGTVQMKLKLQ